MPTVQLFITCLADTFYPETGRAIVDILQRLGLRVEFPTAQTCCGQPAFNAGMWKEARKMACHMIQVLEKTKGHVVAPSGSCIHMLRHAYPELFRDDPHWLPRAQALAERSYEFSEYLVDILGVTDVGARWQGRLAYHPSCHLLRGLGIDRQPRLLLSHLQGATLVDLPYAEECCGFGGVFSVDQPEVSTEMLLRKIANIQASQADAVVVADTGCRLHITGGLHRKIGSQSLAQIRVMHLAEVLANR